MPGYWRCSSCGRSGEARDELIDKSTACAGCGKLVTIWGPTCISLTQPVPRIEQKALPVPRLSELKKEAKPSRFMAGLGAVLESRRRESLMRAEGPGIMECPFCHGHSFSVKHHSSSRTGCAWEALGLLLVPFTLGLSLLLLIPGHVAHKKEQSKHKRVCNTCGQILGDVWH